MKRSILLVICDFMILSMLAIARFDSTGKDEPEPPVQQSHVEATAEGDLIEVLRVSLEAERGTQETLSTELEQTRLELAERERLLQERESALEKATSSLSEQEEAARRLAAEREQLAAEKEEAERERRRLAEQFTEAQKRLREVEEERVTLTRTLGELNAKASVSAEQLRIMQESLQQREQDLEAARRELESLSSDRRVSDEERREIEMRLRIAETERQIAEQNLAAARTEVEAARLERERLEQERVRLEQTTSRLAEGVSDLARTTEGIEKEVRRSQPMSANAIFDQFRSNRVKVTFSARERGAFGTSRRDYELETVLVEHGGVVHALMHAANTPFQPGSNALEAVEGIMQIGNRRYRINQIDVFADDPRLLAVPVPRDTAEESGLTIFSLSDSPFRYPDAVLITASGDRYGETSFRLDPELGRYVRMRGSIITDIFGEFSPGRGDLVFSKTGEILGIMTNNRIALVLDGLSSEQNIPLGQRFDPVATAQLLKTQEYRLSQLQPAVR